MTTICQDQVEGEEGEEEVGEGEEGEEQGEVEINEGGEGEEFEEGNGGYPNFNQQQRLKEAFQAWVGGALGGEGGEMAKCLQLEIWIQFLWHLGDWWEYW